MDDYFKSRVPEYRAQLQRMKTAPEGPIQAAFKSRILDGMSDPDVWADELLPVVWYGWQRFEEGWLVGFDWAST